MIDAAVKALSQMFSPPFRSVLLKSAALALAFVAVIAIALYELVVWLATYGAAWSETMLGGGAHTAILVIAWLLSLAAGLGIIVGSIFLMPAVTALVGSLFVDEIALEVERTHYPTALGAPPPLMQSVVEGFKT